MRPDRDLLQDILEAIDEVVENTPLSKDAFDGNKLLRSHLLRQIQIVGEACWRLSQPLKDQNSELPWKKIAGMRHVLVHDYFEVNWDRVYETARDHVPALRPQIVKLLEFLGPEAP